MERREAAPIMLGGVITIRFNEGEYKGAALVGLIRNFTEDEIGVVLDGGLFSRGTSVQLQMDHGSRLTAWVRECVKADGSSWLDLSLSPIDATLSYGLADSCQSG